MSYIIGTGLTPFGRHEGSTTLTLMADAAEEALTEGELERADIDAVLCGYSSTLPHLMLADYFSEFFGLSPSYAHTVQMGGATGLGLVMLAERIADPKRTKNILVVAGENRLTGQTRDNSIQMLAQVGHARYETPLGGTVPAYYALLGDYYLQQHDLSEQDLAELAVLMRAYACDHPGAHLRGPIDVQDVMNSKPIATPLKMLDCCPISDGSAAIVVSTSPHRTGRVKIRGAAQAHQHQHICAVDRLDNFGAAKSSKAALEEAGIQISDIDYAAIYDSFTVTLAILLEEIGFSEPGRAAADAASGYYGINGQIPLNTHGGLLSYGHCGVAGGLSHLVEASRQISGAVQNRPKAENRRLAFVHADGGILSAHVSMILEREG